MTFNKTTRISDEFHISALNDGQNNPPAQIRPKDGWFHHEVLLEAMIGD